MFDTIMNLITTLLSVGGCAQSDCQKLNFGLFIDCPDAETQLIPVPNHVVNEIIKTTILELMKDMSGSEEFRKSLPPDLLDKMDALSGDDTSNLN